MKNWRFCAVRKIAIYR